MIKKFFIPIILLMGFGFSSCDEDDLATVLPDIDINVSEKEIIPVNVDKTDGEWVGYTSTENISIVNSSTEKYLNKIKKVKIKSLRYRVLNFLGDPKGEVKGSFSAANGPAFGNNFVVQSAFANGTTFEVADPAELTRIANELKTKHTIQVTYSGNALCDHDAMDFDIEVELIATVTVDP